jgi:hypothetical protein
MRSRTVHLPPGPCPQELLLAASVEAGREPDVALAFLPPDENLRETLRAMAAAWPDALRFGCEAVTQFADSRLTTQGSIQLFWFDAPHHYAAVEVIPGTHGEPPSPKRVEAVARRVAAADGALLLVDGLRFPAERFLTELRRILLGTTPVVAGGLASQPEPVTRAGARVFSGDRVLPAAALVVTFHGVEMRVEVTHGWIPASPIYTVTRAESPVVYEIDGEPATDWYRRFFMVNGHLAPMPATANRFPLIIEGPQPERQGLYRSMRFFDEPPGAVTFWGTVEKGDLVRLGMGNDLSLVETASKWLSGKSGGAPQAAILCSCAGREAVLGEKAAAEVARIHEALGGAALSGFSTFGEIGPAPRGGLAYYNLTALLVLLHEAEP